MNLFYFDILGNRCWTTVPGVQELATASESPNREDIVFIHISDFLKMETGNLSNVPLSDRPLLQDMREALRQYKKVGDGHAGVVLYTGASVVEPDEEVTIRSILCEHEKQQLVFMPNVNRGMTAAQLQERLFPLAGQYEEQGSKNLASCVSDLGDQAVSREVHLAFRILWQAYVLAKLNIQELPEELYPVRQKLQGSTFDKEYWLPILKDGKLDDRLSKDPDDDIARAVAVMRDQEDWNDLSIPAKVISEYMQKWSVCASGDARPDCPDGSTQGSG